MPSRRFLFFLAVLCLSVIGIALAEDFDEQSAPSWVIKKLGVDLDMRSMGRILADEMIEAGGVMALSPDAVGAIQGLPVESEVKLRGPNIQVNDPTFDTIQIFPGFRPFVHSTESETSISAHGPNIVATYNTSAGLHLSPAPSPPFPPGSLIVDRVNLSGFSVSNDGGRSWRSGFMPGAGPGAATFGDPSVAVDRHGNFFFSGLGTDTNGKFAIVANKSTDGGQTWSPAVVVQQDDGGDKEWIAVGRDPNEHKRDNVYVTWTSFQATGGQLRFGRSTDGGTTFTAKTIFAPAPDADPTHPQNFAVFTNPVVDGITGRLYIPFLQFSNSDQDFIRILISDDAGETFHFATFNIPGAPLPTLLPVTQSGELTECGATIVRPPGRPAFLSVNLRLTIHAGASTTIGTIPNFPFRRFISASRLVTQPAIAARGGMVFLAWSNSTSTTFGDPDGRSNILFTRSNDGGETWAAPVQANPDVPNDVHHVLPSLGIDRHPEHVHILYYTQHVDGTVDVDLANSEDDYGDSFPSELAARITSTPFTLAPTNIPLVTAAQPFATTNYDRQIASCYSLGEYLSVTSVNGKVSALWGDERNTVTQPINPLDPISGQKHSQQDVFFQKAKVE